MSHLAFSPARSFLAHARTNTFPFLSRSSVSSRRTRVSPATASRARPFIVRSSATQYQSPFSQRDSQPQRNNPASVVFSNTYNSIVYKFIPLLLCGGTALPSLAANGDTTAPVSPNDAFVSDAAQDDSVFSRVLGTIVLFMLVYATLGAIILSINSFWENQNERREIALIKQKLEVNPGRKTMSDDGSAAKKATAKVAPGPPLSGNRESRRTEKKMRERELREQKRREKRAEARAAKSGDESKS